MFNCRRLVHTGGDIMEKRHYLEVSDANLASILTFSRVVDENQVTGYNINGTTYNITGGKI